MADSPSRPIHKIVTDDFLSLPVQDLRLGVKKRVVEGSDGLQVVPPYSLIHACYKIIAIAPEVTVHGGGTSRSPAKSNDLPPGTETIIEEKDKLPSRMMLGMEALNLGIEIAVSSMRNGERSLFFIPSALTHPDGVDNRMQPQADWWLDIKLTSVSNGQLLSTASLRHEVVKFVEQAAPASAAAAQRPAFEAAVAISIKSQPNPTHQKIKFVVGSEDSQYFLDQAVMSMEVREAATVFHNKQEHFIMLVECEQPKSHFEQLPELDLQGQPRWRCVLDSHTRVDEANHRLTVGHRLCLRQDYEMAIMKFQYALNYLTAHPALTGVEERIVFIYLQISESKLIIGDWASAYQYADAAARMTTPSDPKAIFLRAKANRFLKRFEEASADLQLLKEVVKTGPLADAISQEDSDLASAVALANAC